MTHKLIKIFSIFAFVMFLGSCNDFEEINTDPNATSEVSPSMLCTSVILKNIKFNGIDAHAYLQPNALSKYLTFSNQSVMPAQYNDIGSSSFANMTILPNIDKMIEYSQGSVMESSYRGVGSFMKAYAFYNLTMQMGDIPYSEANQGAQGNYKPVYDRQEDVFKGILDELAAADQYFATGQTFTGDPTPYAGNPAKWRRANNAFALKVLMSLSKKADANALLNIKTRFADIVASGQLLESGTGYLGLVYTSANPHPMSGTNNLFTSRTDISDLLINHLKNLNDRRLFYVADPAAEKISQGLTQTDWNAYVGVNPALDYSVMTANHLAGKYSLLNARYLQNQTSEPRMMVTYAEQQLILAEARIRGWITTGTAQNYYETGVKSALEAMMATTASYAHGMALTSTYINGYFTGEAAFKTDPADQLKQIWLQRYILNFMQDATQSYYEFRRTGYPEFPVDPSTNLNVNNLNGFPMRWLYPSSELTYNQENYVNAVNSQFSGYDEVNKIMWLLQ